MDNGGTIARIAVLPEIAFVALHMVQGVVVVVVAMNVRHPYPLSELLEIKSVGGCGVVDAKLFCPRGAKLCRYT